MADFKDQTFTGKIGTDYDLTNEIFMYEGEDISSQYDGYEVIEGDIKGSYLSTPQRVEVKLKPKEVTVSIIFEDTDTEEEIGEPITATGKPNEEIPLKLFNDVDARIKSLTDYELVSNNGPSTGAKFGSKDTEFYVIMKKKEVTPMNNVSVQGKSTSGEPLVSTILKGKPGALFNESEQFPELKAQLDSTLENYTLIDGDNFEETLPFTETNQEFNMIFTKKEITGKITINVKDESDDSIVDTKTFTGKLETLFEDHVEWKAWNDNLFNEVMKDYELVDMGEYDDNAKFTETEQVMNIIVKKI